MKLALKFRRLAGESWQELFDKTLERWQPLADLGARHTDQNLSAEPLFLVIQSIAEQREPRLVFAVPTVRRTANQTRVFRISGIIAILFADLAEDREPMPAMQLDGWDFVLRRIGII